MNILDEEKKFGVAILERQMLEKFRTLWEGPLNPENLDLIEQTIRAFLVSPTLSVSWVKNDLWDTVAISPDGKFVFDSDDFYEPLDETCLMYEFTNFKNNHPISSVSKDESEFIRSNILTELQSKALSLIPKWVKTEAEAFTFIDYWYAGHSLSECEAIARNRECHPDHYSQLPFKRDESLGKHAIGHYGPGDDLNYLIGSHRSGAIVYGNTPVTKFCQHHLFSKWPDFLFKKLGEHFQEASNQLRGPGIGVTLPPLTSLILSRAPSRYFIPETIRDLRDEYKKSRKKLWDLLITMWTAPTFKKQLKVLEKLNKAADSIYFAAFPERYDVLSLGISATSLNLSSTLSQIHTQNIPKARVASVSFAAKLSKNLRKHLLNCRDILNKHLSNSELKQFGI